MNEDQAAVIRDREVTVAEDRGEIVGVLALGVEEGRFTVLNVAVAPSRQGIGLGRELLELAEERARDAGFGELHLYTHELMTENRALYRRIGYEEHERRAEQGFARVFMRKRLD
jgi:ribosomal protein S18 acetylase RimI-like enzyme